MKIILEPPPPEPQKWIGQITCDYCGCVLEVEESDLLFHPMPEEYKEWGEESPVEVFFVCAYCKKNVEITDELPQEVIRRLADQL